MTQLCEYFLSGNPDQLLNAQIREQKYPGLNNGFLLQVLPKYKVKTIKFF